MKEMFIGAAIGTMAGIMLGMNPQVRKAIEQAKAKLNCGCGQNKSDSAQKNGAQSANGCECATCGNDSQDGACECGDDCDCYGACECDSDTCL